MVGAVHHGIFVAPFAQLADPYRLIDLGHAAEEAGWDGVFLWDHVLRPEANEIIDTWVGLAALALATDRLRLGPMVTPITRRRPIKLAREVVSVDLLSQGRLTLGMGLGVDSGGELSRFDEIVDPRIRGERLDEGIRILAALLEGETLAHVGEHFRVDGVSLEPRPVQRPRPPIWLAARGQAMKPVRRAARYEGIFPIEVNAGSFGRMVDEIVSIRGDLDGFDICLRAEPDGSPPIDSDHATWLLRPFDAVVDLDHLFAVTMHGPPR